MCVGEKREYVFDCNLSGLQYVVTNYHLFELNFGFRIISSVLVSEQCLNKTIAKFINNIVNYTTHENTKSPHIPNFCSQILVKTHQISYVKRLI